MHRPYILRQLGTDRYERSREAVFESAISDFRTRKAFAEHTDLDTIAYISSAYREFQSTMIAGIYLVLYPRGKDASIMHEILNVFIAHHAGEDKELDETTRRELKTIQFLQNKVNNFVATDGAQLLLDLHSSQTGPSSKATDGTIKSEGVTMQAVVPSSTSPTSPALIALSTVVPAGNQPFLFGQTSSLTQNPFNDVSMEDGNTAQSLLDYWCNTVDSGNASNDFTSAWESGAIRAENLGSSSTLDTSGALESGSDWTYWEELVNQIRSDPVM